MAFSGDYSPPAPFTPDDSPSTPGGVALAEIAGGVDTVPALEPPLTTRPNATSPWMRHTSVAIRQVLAREDRNPE